MKLVVLAAALSLPACASTDERGYPSLQPRAAERAGFDEPAVAAPVPVVADPALDATLRDIGGKLTAIAKGFDADAAIATRAAAIPGARTAGSEAWLTAQTALAALDDWRAQASSLASDAEALAGERSAAVGTAYPALDALRARAGAEADREAAAIAAISARLPTS